MKKLEIVDDWKVIWKTWSMRLLALLVFLSGLVLVLIETLPDHLLQSLTTRFPILVFVLSTIGGISRYVKQFKIHPEPEAVQTAAPAAQPKDRKMSVFSSIIAEAKVDAENAARAAGEAALKASLAAIPAPYNAFFNALVTVAENPSMATAIAQAEALAPTIEALIAEAEANGVTKAVYDPRKFVLAAMDFLQTLQLPHDRSARLQFIPGPATG